MYAVRVATADDFGEVFVRTKAFNANEGIAIADATLATGLRRLLDEPQLGGAWLVLRDGAIVGHAVGHVPTTRRSGSTSAPGSSRRRAW